jgi:hypothetical protein
MNQSYIFFLYFLKYPPQKYQTEGLPDKLVFRDIERTEEEQGVLYVVGANAYTPSPEKKILNQIMFLDGTPAYVVYTNI